MKLSSRYHCQSTPKRQWSVKKQKSLSRVAPERF
nr:MAG TPA: hypothetical protein [Caudoviricetes sp.]